MGRPLNNPPVYFTVVQVRFNTILKLADFLPNIQESMRHGGYADFNAQKSVILQVTIQDGQPTPVPMHQERFLFGNLEKTHCFVLDGQSLTLQSTKYGSFEAFSEAFLSGLRLVHEAVQLAFTERIGLRYLDRVAPSQGDNLDLYLVPEVQGLMHRLQGKSLYSFSESLTEFDSIKLMSRVVIQEGGLAFPPDIQPGNMVVDKRFLDYVGPGALLDNDGYIETREEFSSDIVAKQLTAIHDVMSSAFKSTATEHAFKAWSEK